MSLQPTNINVEYAINFSKYRIEDDNIKDFIKRLKEFEFESVFDKDSDNFIAYEPIGVCGLITPWNWPINQITLKVAPAFAANNAWFAEKQRVTLTG